MSQNIIFDYFIRILFCFAIYIHVYVELFVNNFQHCIMLQINNLINELMQVFIFYIGTTRVRPVFDIYRRLLNISYILTSH